MKLAGRVRRSVVYLSVRRQGGRIANFLEGEAKDFPVDQRVQVRKETVELIDFSSCCSWSKKPNCPRLMRFDKEKNEGIGVSYQLFSHCRGILKRLSVFRGAH